MMIT